MQKTLTLHVSKSLAELWEKLKKKKIPVEEDFKQEMVLSLVRKHRITGANGSGWNLEFRRKGKNRFGIE